MKITSSKSSFLRRAARLGLLVLLAGLILTGGPERLVRATGAGLPLRDTLLPSIPAGNNPFAVAVNPVTNKIYVTNRDSDNVMVIDGATNATTNVSAGDDPIAVAVNPVTNKVYVANKLSNTVTVLDGATNATTTVSAGISPEAVAVNPVTNKVYVANELGDTMTVIDGVTNATTTVSAGDAPFAVAVNPVTNKVYVANRASNTVTVIDGVTNATATVSTGSFPTAVAVNPVTNKVYVANRASNTVTVIDGVTNATATVSTGSFPTAVAVNPVTNKLYTANFLSDNVTAISEQPSYPIPLVVTISWLPGRTSASPNPTFTFLTESQYAPTASPIQALYYQVDSWTGPWLPAILNSNTSPLTALNTSQWSATIPAQPNGIHILYAYATDGQEAGSVNPSPNYSPIPAGSAPICSWWRRHQPVAFICRWY
jgi:YVTN family beta-propeller protein